MSLPPIALAIMRPLLFRFATKVERHAKWAELQQAVLDRQTSVTRLCKWELVNEISSGN